MITNTQSDKEERDSLEIKKFEERGSKRIKNKKKDLGGEEKERKNKGNRDYGERDTYI